MYIHLCLLYALNIPIFKYSSGTSVFWSLYNQKSILNVHFLKNSDCSYVTRIVPDNHVLVKGVSLIQGSGYSYIY